MLSRVAALAFSRAKRSRWSSSERMSELSSSVRPTPVITDQTSFDQWYRDTPGVNETFEIPVTLPDTGGGNLVYDSAAFFPIDGMGFGNSAGEEHNFHFTT